MHWRAVRKVRRTVCVGAPEGCAAVCSTWVCANTLSAHSSCTRVGAAAACVISASTGSSA